MVPACFGAKSVAAIEGKTTELVWIAGSFWLLCICAISVVTCWRCSHSGSRSWLDAAAANASDTAVMAFPPSLLLVSLSSAAQIMLSFSVIVVTSCPTNNGDKTVLMLSTTPSRPRRLYQLALLASTRNNRPLGEVQVHSPFASATVTGATGQGTDASNCSLPTKEHQTSTSRVGVPWLDSISRPTTWRKFRTMFVRRATNTSSLRTNQRNHSHTLATVGLGA